MPIITRRFCRTVLVFAMLAAGPALLPLTAQTTPGSDAVAAAGPSAAPTGPSTVAAIQSLRPALDKVSTVIAGLTIPRWKAPGDVRSGTQQDVNSISRDLASTLPPLLDQAQAPGALAPSFAVYRNIDALYDVLLRVTEMASLAGAASEASQLEAARAGLEAARGQLGDALLQSVAAQDSQVVQLRAAVAAEAKSKQAETPPEKNVVEDGPAPKPKTNIRKRPVTKAPATKAPATQAPATPQ